MKLTQFTTLEQYKFIKANVSEEVNNKLINLQFNIAEGEKFYVDRINIYGNTITAENVIRNQFELDEGDPFSEILVNKSINNIKSLNFFKTVNSKIHTNDNAKTKEIDIFYRRKTNW
jgi:outer membrane protein insertion porin family